MKNIHMPSMVLLIFLFFGDLTMDFVNVSRDFYSSAFWFSCVALGCCFVALVLMSIWKSILHSTHNGYY